MDLIVADIATGDMPHTAILKIPFAVLKQTRLNTPNDFFSEQLSYFASQNFFICVDLFNMIFTKIYDFTWIISPEIKKTKCVKVLGSFEKA